MELLVKQASLSLFLKEQCIHYEKKIIEEIETNNVLSENLKNMKEILKKLNALDEKIQSNPNVKLLEEVINSASKRRPTLDEVVEDFPPITKILFLSAKNINKTMTNIVKIILK